LFARKSEKRRAFFAGHASGASGGGADSTVSDFENRCELGTIKTPLGNSSVFWKPKCGTREARPTDFPPFFQTNSDSRLRRGELFFRQGGGAKSEAILTHSICFDTKRIFAILNLPPPKIAYFNDHLWFHFEQS